MIISELLGFLFQMLQLNQYFKVCYIGAEIFKFVNIEKKVNETLSFQMQHSVVYLSLTCSCWPCSKRILFSSSIPHYSVHMWALKWPGERSIRKSPLRVCESLVSVCNTMYTIRMGVQDEQGYRF